MFYINIPYNVNLCFRYCKIGWKEIHAIYVANVILTAEFSEIAPEGVY